MIKCEETLLKNISNKNKIKKDIAIAYYFALMSIDRIRINWRRINQAIVNRWSFSALKYIKYLAWSGKCFED